MQLNLSLTLKGWVALVFKSCSPVHSPPASHCYPAAGKCDAGAVSAVRHGEPLHCCHKVPKEIHPSRRGWAWPKSEGLERASAMGVLEGCCVSFILQ